MLSPWWPHIQNITEVLNLELYTIKVVKSTCNYWLNFVFSTSRDKNKSVTWYAPTRHPSGSQWPRMICSQPCDCWLPADDWWSPPDSNRIFFSYFYTNRMDTWLSCCYILSRCTLTSNQIFVATNYKWTRFVLQPVKICVYFNRGFLTIYKIPLMTPR